jgi:hypothetical protein
MWQMIAWVVLSVLDVILFVYGIVYIIRKTDTPASVVGTISENPIDKIYTYQLVCTVLLPENTAKSTVRVKVIKNKEYKMGDTILLWFHPDDPIRTDGGGMYTT